MSTTAPFASTIEANYNYIAAAVAYLNVPANTARFDITANNLTILNTLFTNPTPPPPGTIPNNLGLKELYALKTDPTTATKVINALYDKKIRQHLPTDPIGIENQLRVIYADIAASALTPADRIVLNLPPKKARSTHQVATQNKVTWTTTGIGGGDVLSKCYPSGTPTLNPSASNERSTGTRATRPHKEAGYQIRTVSIILAQTATAPTLAQVPDLNKPLPTGTVWTIRVDTKARAVYHMGTVNEGNILYEFKQWHKPAHPNLDGPLSGPEKCIIT